MNSTTKLLPLGKLLNVIESAGYTVEYQYNDLVFVDHTAFLFQFDMENPGFVMLRFNTECENEAKEGLTNVLMTNAKKEGVKLVIASDYTLENNTGTETFTLTFKE
jgi:hypothetical protein